MSIALGDSDHANDINRVMGITGSGKSSVCQLIIVGQQSLD